MTELIALQRPERSLFWTAPVEESGEMGAEDPLGLDYVAQQIGLLLLPTLTTRSSRAQAYAMVLYGLSLAERALSEFALDPTDEARRKLFERWERVWALATLEYRGELRRGDLDAMRGIRGATAVWKRSRDKLPLDFELISRQQELGQLGAYLAPLRRTKLVLDGSLQPGPAAHGIIDAFWDEPAEKKHRRRYDEYALAALNPAVTKLERKRGNLTLGKLGERSRLLSLSELGRGEQQRRLYDALFAAPQGPHTTAVSDLVQAATRAKVVAAREILEGAIGGRFGPVAPDLLDVLRTAHAFGNFMQELLVTFDRCYATVERRGWVSRSDVVAAIFTNAHLAALQATAERLLASPAVDRLRVFPMHGAACLRLASELRVATPDVALELVLAHHGMVQRTRCRGAAWIREDGGKLMLHVTSYTARPDGARFPSFKLDVVRSLLTDLGKLPRGAGVLATEVVA